MMPVADTCQEADYCDCEVNDCIYAAGSEMSYFRRLNCAENLEKHLQELHKIWDQMYCENTKALKEEETKKRLLNMVEKIVKKEERKKNTIINSIEDLLKEVRQLVSEVGVKPPFDDSQYEALSLPEIETAVREKVTEYRKLKEERVSTYAKLRAKEKELCECLGTEELYEIPNPVPSEQQLSQFEEYIKFKSNEKDRLAKIFYNTKSSIMEIMRELEMTPLSDFEKKVVYGDESSFKLSDENLAKLRELHNTLIQEREATKNLSLELRKKLCKLWQRLDKSFDAQTAFLDAHSSYSVKAIAALKTEITCCEEKQRQNIQVYIEKVRQEISDLWNKCCFGEAQKQKFMPYYSDSYTEDLLGLHEVEIERLERFYEANKSIYRLMEERQKLLNKKMALESGANNKRLFEHRRGQLLQEERERNAIRKQLQKVEEDISYLVKRYEEKHNEPFLYNDIKLSSLFEDQRNKYQEKKKMTRIHTNAQISKTETRQPFKRIQGATTLSSTVTKTPKRSKPQY